MLQVKTLIFGTLTFILGGFVGYKLCERQLEEVYRQDLEDVLHRMQKYDDNIKEKKEEEVEKQEDIIVMNRKKPEEAIKKVDYAKFAKPNLFDYAKAIEESYEEEDEPDENEEKEENEEELDEEIIEDFEDDEENQYEPYLILEEQYNFAINHNGDEGQLLFYYTEDQIVCEESDMIVDDYDRIIGYDFESALENASKTWVRNPNLKTVYEIHKVNASYEQAVAKIIETPKEKEFRHAGRLKQAKDDE